MENHNGEMHGKTCKCPHHKVLPAIIVLIGLDFLLGTVGVFTWGFVDISWPVLVIIAGLMKMNQGSCKCC